MKEIEFRIEDNSIVLYYGNTKVATLCPTDKELLEDLYYFIAIKRPIKYEYNNIVFSVMESMLNMTINGITYDTCLVNFEHIIETALDYPDDAYGFEHFIIKIKKEKGINPVKYWSNDNTLYIETDTGAVYALYETYEYFEEAYKPENFIKFKDAYIDHNSKRYPEQIVVAAWNYLEAVFIKYDMFNDDPDIPLMFREEDIDNVLFNNKHLLGVETISDNNSILLKKVK